MKRVCKKCNHIWECEPSKPECKQRCISICLSCSKKDNEDVFRDAIVEDITMTDCFKLEDKNYIMAVLI
jgi:hypothetical protein